jgi:hypothetical protein
VASGFSRKIFRLKAEATGADLVDSCNILLICSDADNCAFTITGFEEA